MKRHTKKHYGIDYTGPNFLFGIQIEYIPASLVDKAKVHALGKQTLPGILVGYKTVAGGGWSGDLEIVDWDELENAKSIGSVHIKRLKHPEVKPVLENCIFIFPCRKGDLRQPGETPSEAKGRRVRHQREKEEQKNRPPESEPELSKGRKVALQGVPTDMSTAQEDFWRVTRSMVIRHHMKPRTNLFVPTDDCPIPLKYLDVMRTTYTDLEGEAIIRDYWSDVGERPLSGQWTGQTMIWILNPDPPPGYHWVDRDLVKTQKSTRPGNVHKLEWGRYGPDLKAQFIAEWAVEKPAREAARVRRGHIKIWEEDVDHFNDYMKSALEHFSEPEAPAMPLWSSFNPSSNPSKSNRRRAKAQGVVVPVMPAVSYHPVPCCSSSSRSHQQRVAPAGYQSRNFYAMVHKPIPLHKAKQIPKALAALEAEWTKLEKTTCMGCQRSSAKSESESSSVKRRD